MQCAAATQGVQSTPNVRIGATKRTGSFVQSVRGTRVQHKVAKAAGQPGLLQQG
jgi:hypothetical protein